jgi:hypothetical protein
MWMTRNNPTCRSMSASGKQSNMRSTLAKRHNHGRSRKTTCRKKPATEQATATAHGATHDEKEVILS